MVPPTPPPSPFSFPSPFPFQIPSGISYPSINTRGVGFSPHTEDSA